MGLPVVEEVLTAMTFVLNNLFFIVIVLSIGTASIKYLAAPKGDYLSYVTVDLFKTLFTMWIPYTKTSWQSANHSLISLMPSTIQETFTKIFTLVLSSAVGVLFIGLVNIFKVLIFIIVWIQIISFIWGWYNVLHIIR